MLKQFLSFSYGSWVSALISLLTIPLITLLIIPEEFGKSSMFILAHGIINQIGMLGMDQSFMRMFYEKNNEARTGLAWLCFSFSFGATIFLAFFLFLFSNQISIMLFEISNSKTMLLLVAYLFFAIADRFSTSVVRMNKKGNTFSIIRIANSFINAVVVIFYAKFISPSFDAIAMGLVISSLITILIAVLSERQFWMKKIDFSLFNIREIKNILHFGLPLVPLLLFTMLFEGMSKIALRTYSSFSEIGLFAAANKLLVFLSLIQAGFTIYWHPLALETYEADHDDYSLYEKMFKYVSILMLFTAAFVLLIKDIIVLFLAPSYRSATQIMPFLVLFPVMYTLADITGVGIILKKRTYLNLLVILAALIFSFAGNIFLVPVFGSKGAALSTGIAYIVYFSVRTFISFRLMPVHFSIVQFVPSFCILIVFLFINTFFTFAWWINLIPVLFIFVLHKNSILTMLYNGIKEFGFIKK